MNFSIGEVVRLKSGGPRMTIVKIGDFSPERFNPGVLCVWFEGAKKYEDVFIPESLERSRPARGVVIAQRF